MPDPIIDHLREENVRLKKILLDMIQAYGKKGKYSKTIHMRKFQPEIIKRAIDAIGEVMT